MKDLFVKKYWKEEEVLFYLHFHNGDVVRQIEITPKEKVLLTLENPLKGESMMYDQSLEELDLQEKDFIEKEEFDKVWNDK